MTYEYRCQKCGRVHEEVRSVDERHAPAPCACGGACDLIPSRFSFTGFQMDSPAMRRLGYRHKKQLEQGMREGKYESVTLRGPRDLQPQYDPKFK